MESWQPAPWWWVGVWPLASWRLELASGEGGEQLATMSGGGGELLALTSEGGGQGVTDGDSASEVREGRRHRETRE